MAVNSGIPLQAMKFPVEVMETDVAPVVAGGPDYGWVVGSPAGLAAAGVVISLFDLGPDWKQYTKVQVNALALGPSSGFTSLQIFSRDDAVQALNSNRRLGFEYGTTGTGNSINSAVTTAGLGVTFNVRPMGRYLIVAASNADGVNAMGAGSKFTVAAYPN